MINYYQILEVADFSSGQAIKKAYRTKCKQYHPDRVNSLGGKLVDVARREMTIINRAYEVLTTAGRREKYDEWLRNAGKQGALRTCRHCGIDFLPRSDSEYTGICPVCNEISREAEKSDPRQGEPVDPESLLRNCFIVLHHFTAAAVLTKFTPTINIIVNNERIKIAGPPGPLEMHFKNRQLFDMIQHDSAARKHFWSHKHNIGKVTFSKSHPVECAASVWNLLNELLNRNVKFEYCRIAINNDEYASYENVLNQCVLVVAAKLSTWTASKLFSRHHRNLAAAMMDHECSVPDPFYTIMAGQTGSNIDEDDFNRIVREKEDLAARVTDTEEELNHFRNKLYEQSSMLEIQKVLINELSGKLEAAVKENERLKNDYARRQAEAAHKMERKLAGATALVDERNKMLRVQEKQLATQDKKLERWKKELYEKEDMISRMSDESEKLRCLAVQAFEQYGEYVPEIPEEKIRAMDVVFILENMEREIRHLREKNDKDTNSRKKRHTVSDVLPIHLHKRQDH